jgi:uncharacterized protein (TIGR02996 family)
MARSKPTAKPTRTTAASPRDPSLQPLLDAIEANPDDLDNLRVYADRLSERGSSLGEYIQLRLIDAATRTAAQTKRIAALEKADRGAWLGEARPFVRSWFLDYELPGFVHRAIVEADQLIAGFDHLRTIGPRTILSVTGMRKQRRQTEARMAALPLGALYDLDLDSNALDDTSITTLAPALGGLRALHLANNEITGVGITALGAHAGALEFLQVGMAVKFARPERERLVDGIAAALAGTPGFRSLRYLHFYRTGAPTAAMVAELRARLPDLSRISTSEYPEWRPLEPARWVRSSGDLL